MILIQCYCQVARFTKQIEDWIANPVRNKSPQSKAGYKLTSFKKREHEWVNISDGPEDLNSYQRRLVHQIVAAKFPGYVSTGKCGFVQVTKLDQSLEDCKKLERKERFEGSLKAAIGLRHVSDLIFESKKPVIGHNVFTDLCCIYQQFRHDLPSNLEEFKFILSSQNMGMLVFALGRYDRMGG